MFLSTGNLSPTDLLSAHLLEYELRTQLETEALLSAMQTVSQLDGRTTRLPHHRARCPRHAWPTTRTSWRGCAVLPAFMDQAIALMDEQLAAGLAQPVVRRWT